VALSRIGNSTMPWFAELLSRVIGAPIRHKVLSGLVSAIIIITGLFSPATVAKAITLKADRVADKIYRITAQPLVDEIRKLGQGIQSHQQVKE